MNKDSLVFYRDRSGQSIQRAKSKRKKGAVNAAGGDAGRCYAQLRKKDGYCKKVAGWGTDHVGIGRCKLHGGSSTGAKYSKSGMTAGVRTFLGTFADHDQDIFKKFIHDKTLDGEIATAKTKLTQHLTKLSLLTEEKQNTQHFDLDREDIKEFGEAMMETGIIPKSLLDLLVFRLGLVQKEITKTDEAVQRYLEIISKMQERDQKIREGLKLTIDIRAVSEIVNKIAIIVLEEMSDHPGRIRIANRIRDIGVLSPGKPTQKALEQGKGVLLPKQLVKLEEEYVIED